MANAYLEGTYSEVYPEIEPDAEGMRRLFRQFSFPGGIPSHVAPETPGSIHEGGELGYALAHAYGAAFDNPDLVVCCVVGDGEAETGPLAASWHSNKFLDPVRDGAVLPILHLNGYKIANPTVLARIPGDELAALMRGYGHRPLFVEGSDPARMHARDGRGARRGPGRHRAHPGTRPGGRAAATRPLWPMIVLRTPKGWTGPDDGRRPAHRGLAGARTRCRSPAWPSGPEHLAQLETWMRSYRPEELFDEDGAPVAAIAELAPRGPRRMSASPHANGGVLLRPLTLPDFRDHAVAVPAPGATDAEATRVLGGLLRDVMRDNAAAPQLPPLRARRDRLQPARRRLRGRPTAPGRRSACPPTITWPPTGG